MKHNERLKMVWKSNKSLTNQNKKYKSKFKHCIFRKWTSCPLLHKVNMPHQPRGATHCIWSNLHHSWNQHSFLRIKDMMATTLTPLPVWAPWQKIRSTGETNKHSATTHQSMWSWKHVLFLDNQSINESTTVIVNGM